MNVLENMKFKTTDDETLRLMGLNELNADTATKWLGNRVSYVIEEEALTLFKLLIKRVIFVDRTDVEYPNKEKIPYAINSENTDPVPNKEKGEEKGMVVMSNMGAALYYGGKTEGKVYGMKVSRGLFKKGIKVPLESPRDGIIQVGEGLFHPNFLPNSKDLNAKANSITRLGTFFHEARHSDGNGESLGFFHSPCPVGHDMEGAAACDENLNGPYSIGAVMTAEMLKTCEESCSETEKERLKIEVLDSKNRVMKITRKGQAAQNWDASPERIKEIKLKFLIILRAWIIQAFLFSFRPTFALKYSHLPAEEISSAQLTRGIL
jgi:hypothetical protein